MARVLVASVLLATGAALVAPALTSAVGFGSRAPNTNDKVCSGEHQYPPNGTSSWTVTAPDGYLISGYCVKAGSAQQGNGPEYHTVLPPAKSVTISHSSGKDISHYAVYYTEAPPETTLPETTLPETTLPETTLPETTLPDTTLPDTTLPDTTLSETTLPDTTLTETTEPPVTTEPETTLPETTLPETTMPETTDPPVTTEPETTEPTATTEPTPHDPPTVSCAGLRIVAHGYDADDTNTVTVTVNGETQTFTFGTSVDRFFPFIPGQANTWSYTIEAPGTLGDFAESGTQAGCTPPRVESSTDLGGELPATGSSSTTLVVIGSALVAAGWAALLLGRRSAAGSD